MSNLSSETFRRQMAEVQLALQREREDYLRALGIVDFPVYAWNLVIVRREDWPVLCRRGGLPRGATPPPWIHLSSFSTRGEIYFTDRAHMMAELGAMVMPPLADTPEPRGEEVP